MTMTDSAWDAARWRDGHATPLHYDRLHSSQAPPLSAPTAINPASQSAILGHNTYDAHLYDIKPRMSGDHVVSGQLSFSDTSTYRNQPQERHSPFQGSNYGQQPPVNDSPHQTPAGTWRNPHHGYRRTSTANTIDAPLTLQIPKPQNLPRISPAYEPRSFGRSIQTQSQLTTSLPSFASLSEKAAICVDESDVDGPEIAPMASRLSCHSCNELQPMVQEVANAVAELDENVQAYCNRPVTRTVDFPNDSPVRAIQWILHRLRYAKRDLQDSTCRAPSSHPYQQQTPLTGLPSRPTSPPNSLKRPAAWDRDDFVVPKRPRSGPSPDHPLRTPYALAYPGDRRTSIDLSRCTAYSPAPMDSAPVSAYPRHGSPGLQGRPPRGLPSPSSLAYPSSAVPSLAPPTVRSGGSPAPSYQPPASSHTASTNSATSAHIADLQHQITLKSLSLQTLQSEYASLLQKLERERVKNQTIEKKTSIADNEVSELTGRNEELVEQVKCLEVRIDDCEKKRDLERAEAAREKEQWGRMLEMGGRIHRQHAEDRQKLVEEKGDLLRRVTAYEEDNKASGDTEVPRPRALEVHVGSDGEASNDTPTIRREVDSLRARTEFLRFCLEDVRHHNQELSAKSNESLKLSNHIAESISKALGDTQSSVVKSVKLARWPNHSVRGDYAPLALPNQPAKTPDHPPQASLSSKEPPAPTVDVPGTQKLLPTKATTFQPSMLTSSPKVGHEIPSGPAELGSRVQPSTTSPEELIRGLGPVPPLQFGTGRYIPQDGFFERPVSSARKEDGAGNMSSPPRNGSIEWTMPTIRQYSIDNEKTHRRTHISPCPQIQSPYVSRSNAVEYAARSPYSQNSPPGPKREEDGSSNSSGSNKSGSPESSGMEPTFTAVNAEKKSLLSDPSRAISVMAEAPSAAGFRLWGAQAERATMPPPPRPFSQAQSPA